MSSAAGRRAARERLPSSTHPGAAALRRRARWARPPRRSRSPAASPSRSSRALLRVQARGLLEGGVDYLLLETCQDTRNIKAALLGIERPSRELGRRAARSRSPARSSRWARCWPASASRRSAPRSTHARPALHRPQLRHRPGVHDRPHPLARARSRAFRVACVPNAGLPDENGKYLETPEMVAARSQRFVRERLAQPGRRLLRHPRRPHPAMLGRRPAAGKPRAAAAAPRAPRSPASTTWRSPTRSRPVIVGERTNVIGSRKFKELIASEQVRGGRRDRAAPRSRRAPRSSTSASPTRTATSSRTCGAFSRS